MSGRSFATPASSGVTRKCGVLKAEDLTALRIHTRHYMPDGAVLARRVNRLKDHEQGICVRCVMDLSRQEPARKAALISAWNAYAKDVGVVMPYPPFHPNPPRDHD